MVINLSVSPKAQLLNPDLVRPDWQCTAPRPTGILWLDKNENLDPVLQALAASIMRDLDPMCLATYPDLSKLYRKLGNWLGVSSNALILTPGSDGAIRMVFEAFVREGDVVVHTSPTFAMYPVYCQMFGANAVPLIYERERSGPSLPTEHILSELDRLRPRLFCLPNPDSPTGTALPEGDLRTVVEFCSKIGTVVLIDEAYNPFYAPTCVPWTQEFPHLVVARTFAKAWGLAGLRMGYAVGQPDTIRYLHKLRPMYEVSTIGAECVERMLDHVDAMMASVTRLLDGKRQFAADMRSLGFDVLDTQGNFQHVGFGTKADDIHQALAGVVLYRKNFNDECLNGYSRFSATTVDNFKLVADAIRRVACSNAEGKK